MGIDALDIIFRLEMAVGPTRGRKRLRPYIKRRKYAFRRFRLVVLHREANEPLPSNAAGPDLLLRRLDCAVIEMLHATRDADRQPPFDTVRAAFTEGGRLYPNAGFRAKTHIQICVRNLACVKGYFRRLGENGRPLLFV